MSIMVATGKGAKMVFLSIARRSHNRLVSKPGMPIPLVIVDLAPPPTPSEPVAVLERACTESMFRARCSVAGASESVEGESDAPLAVAIVSWQDEDKLRVRIEVGVRQAGRQRWMVRTISFHPQDDAVERWRTVGLTVGTLVGEAAPEVAVPPASPVAEELPKSTTKASANRPEPAQPVAAQSQAADGAPIAKTGVWCAELGVFGAAGAEDAHARLGGYASLGHTFAGSHIFVIGTPAYAKEFGGSDGLSVGRLTLAAGAGVEVPTPWFSSVLRLRLEGIGERLHVVVEDMSTGERDAGSHWTPGIRAGVDGIWPLGSACSVVVGGSAWTLWNRTEVRVREHTVSTDAPFGAGLGVGVRGELK